ncbi:MAG: aspartate aminotransferase [Candidatus Marinamargulisbacteria bacterium]|jgi:aspartate aminotransferase
MIDLLKAHIKPVHHSETLLTNELSNRLESEGKTVFKFGFGQSPFLPLDSAVAALKYAASRKEYLGVQGLPALRLAVANFHNELGGTAYTEKQVLIGPGSKMLIYCILGAVKNADVILVTPSWVSYEPQAKFLGHEVHRIKTTFEDRWRLRPEALDQLCSELKVREKPLIMILNYPGNPDGLSYTSDELGALAKIARKHHILIVSDEIYGLLHHEGEHHSIHSHYPEGTIVTTGLSKWCGVGGWRVGVALLPQELAGEFMNAVIGIASETFSSVTTPIQLAAVEAYRFSDEVQGYLRHQRRILSQIGTQSAKQLQESGIRVHAPEGGFYLYLDFSPFRGLLKQRGIISSQALCASLLKDAGVAVLSGVAFGQASEDLCVRLAYVDFDGELALRASEELGLEVDLPEDFLFNYANKILEGITRIGKWINQ